MRYDQRFGRVGGDVADEAVQLTLALSGGTDSDARELDLLTAQLRQRLLELDVTSVNAVRSDEIPAGAKPVDPITIGALLVTLTPAVLQAVVSLVETWSAHRRVGNVKLTIDGDSIEFDADPVLRQRAVELFLEKHAER